LATFNDVRTELKEKDYGMFVALEIAGKIMAARERKGISQNELSKISGVAQKTISRIENAMDTPRISTLFKLTSALDLTLDISIQ
jgi:transcriptional regulator with XRE-family HTH domain